MKLLELDDQDEWWGIRDPEVERAFDAACEELSRARRREDKLLALRSGVEALKKFDDYGTAIRDLGVRAVTYGMKLADIKSVIGQDFGYPPHEVSDDIDELVDVAQDEDESILSSLPTPDPSSLPIIVPEVLQAKRKLVIEGMKAERSH